MRKGAGGPHKWMSRKQHRPTTSDPQKNKFRRVMEALLDPENHILSNRQIAKLVSVDEAMVRKYRNKLEIPPFVQGKETRDDGMKWSKKQKRK